jgi:hypothetical protein
MYQYIILVFCATKSGILRLQTDLQQLFQGLSRCVTKRHVSHCRDHHRDWTPPPIETLTTDPYHADHPTDLLCDQSLRPPPLSRALTQRHTPWLQICHIRRVLCVDGCHSRSQRPRRLQNVTDKLCYYSFLFFQVKIIFPLVLL